LEGITVKTKNILVLASSLLLFTARVSAERGDPEAPGYNLEPGFPTDLVDAYAIEPRSLVAQGVVRYERTDNDRDHFAFRPKVAYGIAPFAHLEVSVPIFTGNADRTGSGDIRLGGHYQFLDEKGLVPALAILGSADIPTGKDSAGLDTTVTLAATRALPIFGGDANDRIHFNISWLHNAGHRSFEREHYYRAAFGYSRELVHNWTGVIDFVREEYRIKEMEANILEGGALYHLDDHIAMSFSAGVGISAESPDFRLGAGFQWTF
jgi:hypothetical protein